ncbi:hypothetical protein LTR64_005313 [Lithohypha guttulata]|uniref:Uncharacterized protein n=1 Tax=Lithohypha guttulata TaxID=1690604 RepID=A0AAN7YEY2_9EURO|nr:hypothetical protein LTR05_006960 [Lithohypha guttulata]
MAEPSPKSSRSMSNSSSSLIRSSPDIPPNVLDKMSMGTVLPGRPLMSSDHDKNTYSQSYITHQRRPALIPFDVELSPEDEQAVRLRTGCVNPYVKVDGSKVEGGKVQKSKQKVVDRTDRTKSKNKQHFGTNDTKTDVQASAKRKASVFDKDDKHDEHEWIEVLMEMDIDS